jgi:hypothetical protein
MRKLITLVSVVFVFTNMSAQLKVHSNGNVSIKTMETPNATLAIGGAGDATQSLFVKSNNVPLRVDRNGSATTSGTWTYAIDAANAVSDTRMAIGISGLVRTTDYSTLNKGRAFGVYGAAGYTTSGYNYAVYGNLLSTQNGAAVVGTLNSMDVRVPGRYAGYFQGDVRTTGNFYGTVLTPSASRSTLMGRSAVMPLSAESDGENSMSVGEKLSQLTAVQYNLSEPQAVQAFAASGDTVAPAPRSVTDIQALEKTHYGLDAEVLKEVYPDLVYESQEGDLCINYTEMIPLLVQSVNELRAQVVSLQGAQTYNVRARNGSETGVGSNALDVTALEQNDPTPFTQTTVVRYTLPESVKSAFLYIYDLNGTQIDQKTLQSRGKSSVTLEAGSLAPGMYLYALVADGKVIDTKRMIITQ